VFPIGDENIRGRGLAFVTLTFIAINFAVFVLLQLDNDAFTYGYSAIPFEITRGVDLIRPVAVPIGGEQVVIPEAPGPDPIQLTLLTSMFMHGGWLHLLGNMLFLFIFGDNVEHRMGPIIYTGFYILAGLIAALAQILVTPNSPIPTLGASGAISGVLGAYIVLWPQNRVTVLVLRFYPMQVPAIIAIGLWALLQFINGLGQIVVSEETSGGVAYLAHIGGFLTGMAAGFLFRRIGGGSQPGYQPSS
jgi:rhomboid family protein